MHLITWVHNHTGPCLDQEPETQPDRKLTKGADESDFPPAARLRPEKSPRERAHDDPNDKRRF